VRQADITSAQGNRQIDARTAAGASRPYRWRWRINGGAVYGLERDQPIVNRNPQGNPCKAKDHEVDVSRVNHQTEKQS
jgi:hypothetical protein